MIGRLRVRFLMVSLKFFTNVILPSHTMALGPTQPLTEMSTRNTSWGVKAAGAQGWQPYHLHGPTVWNLGASTSWNPQGLYRAGWLLLPQHLCHKWAILTDYLQLTTIWRDTHTHTYIKPEAICHLLLSLLPTRATIFICHNHWYWLLEEFWIV